MNGSFNGCTKGLDLGGSGGFLVWIPLPLMMIFATFALITLILLFFQFFVLFPKGAIHEDYRIIFLSSNLIGILDVLICFCFLCYHISGVSAAMGQNEFKGISMTQCSLGIAVRFYLRAYNTYALICSGLERLIMAAKKRFEDPPHLTTQGILILGASLSLPIVWVAQYLTRARMGPGYCYCISQLDQGFSVKSEITRKVGLIVLCASGLLFHALAYKINKQTIADFHLGTMTHSLRQRFVLSSNIKLGKVLIHFVTLHMICETCFSLVSIAPHLQGTPSHEALVFMKAFFYFIAILQSFLQVVIQNLYHETFKKRARKLMGIPTPRVEPEHDSILLSIPPESPAQANGILLKLWETEALHLRRRAPRE